MCAIMGPSGSGKTSLLNVLSGWAQSGEIIGDIRINGRRRPQKSWRKIVGLVEQDDIVYGHLTVKECISFYADMKLDESSEARENRVNRIIHRFGLEEVCGSYIGNAEVRGVSGGERKRVCVASELVSEPQLVFLDEPTSGLDAFNSLSLVRAVRDYAQQHGRAVLMTIHQPRIALLRLFDNIALMADGKCAFFGSIDEALVHFKRLGYPCPNMENPGDFFLDLLTVNHESAEEERASVERLKHILANNNGVQIPTSDDPIAVPRRQYATSRGRQFLLLAQRDIKTTLRNYKALVAEFAALLVAGTFMSFVFFQLKQSTAAGTRSTLGLLFFTAATVISGTINPILSTWVVEGPMIRKDRYGKVFHISTAYAARLTAVLPPKFLLFTLWSFIVYYITGLRTDSFAYFVVFWAIIMAETFTGTMLGFALAGSSRSLLMIGIIHAFTYMMMILYAGYFAIADQITWILRWLQYLSVPFYTYAGLAQNEFDGAQNGTIDGDQVIALYQLNQLPVVACGLALFGYGLLLCLAGYGGLYRTTKPKLTFERRDVQPAAV